jgi:hypothetical protein
VNTTGIHTISFSQREDGFEFDKWKMDMSYTRPRLYGPEEKFYGSASIEKISMVDRAQTMVSVWPNPFSTSVDIFVRRASSGARHEVRLEVFNIAGKMVANIRSRATSDACPAHRCGERRATSYAWHARNQPAGTYIVKVKTENREIAERITLRR